MCLSSLNIALTITTGWCTRQTRTWSVSPRASQTRGGGLETSGNSISNNEWTKPSACNPKRSAGFVFLPSSQMFSLHDKSDDAIYLVMLMSYNNYTSPHNRILSKSKRQNVPRALALKNSRRITPVGAPFLSSYIREKQKMIIFSAVSAL